MLEVHPPHKAIETFKEFLLHLLTITVGLLIALGLERVVEWRHHAHLVELARETLHTEIEANAKSMDGAVAAIEKRQKEMNENLQSLADVVASKKVIDESDESLNVRFNEVHIEDTSWRTVQQTGVLAYMPYEDARTFSAIYAAQERFSDNQSLLAEDLARVWGLGRKFNLEQEKKMSPEQAAILAEQFGIWQAHLTLSHLLARTAAEYEHAFLEGRTPVAGFGEKF